MDFDVMETRLYQKKSCLSFLTFGTFYEFLFIISVKMFLKCGYTSDYLSGINEKNVAKVLKDFARETLLFYILEVSILIW